MGERLKILKRMARSLEKKIKKADEAYYNPPVTKALDAYFEAAGILNDPTKSNCEHMPEILRLLKVFETESKKPTPDHGKACSKLIALRQELGEVNNEIYFTERH